MVKNIVGGALFDFIEYLTTRDQPFLVGAAYEPTKVLEALEAWAADRQLDLSAADVQHWRDEID